MWKKLQFRNSGPVLVREEQHPFGQLLDILYLADFHFTAGSTKRAKALADQVISLQPQVVLLGGDYADTPRGLKAFVEFIRAIAARMLVVAVAGNHDWLYRRRLPELVQKAGGTWLATGQTQQVVLAGGYQLHIAAPDALSVSPAHKVLRVLCAHQPPNFAQLYANYDVLFAGHLHGGQLVLWQRNNELYPGRWFYRYNGLRYRLGDSQLLVSRGLADTVPIRYNCPRELIRLHLAPSCPAPIIDNSSPNAIQ